MLSENFISAGGMSSIKPWPIMTGEGEGGGGKEIMPFLINNEYQVVCS